MSEENGNRVELWDISITIEFRELICAGLRPWWKIRYRMDLRVTILMHFVWWHGSRDRRERCWFLRSVNLSFKSVTQLMDVLLIMQQQDDSVFPAAVRNSCALDPALNSFLAVTICSSLCRFLSLFVWIHSSADARSKTPNGTPISAPIATSWLEVLDASTVKVNAIELTTAPTVLLGAVEPESGCKWQRRWQGGKACYCRE